MVFRRLARKTLAWLSLALIIVIGVALSIHVSVSSAQYKKAQARAEFERQAIREIAALKVSINASFGAITALAALYESRGNVERDEFQRFCETILADEPSIQALEWAQVVTNEQRATVERRLSSDYGFDVHFTERDNGQMTVARERPRYVPVTYITPMRGNEVALAFDLASEPTRRAALEQAERIGQPVASGRIQSVQENNEYSFLLFRPVFAATGTPRRMTGLILGLMRIQAIVAASANIAQGGLHNRLLLLDRSAPAAEQVLYPRDVGENPAELLATAVTSEVVVGGRVWRIVILPPQSAGPAIWIPQYGVLAGGLLLTCNLGVLVLIGAHRWGAAEHEHERLDRLLRQSSERLTLATESAGIGIWDWDISENRLVWDSRMYELYGIDEQSFSGAYDAWQTGLHQDDRERGDLAIQEAIRGVHDFNIEFRVLWPNGEVHDIEAHALVQKGRDGRAARMIGVNWDITERKRAAEALLASERRYRDLFELTHDGIILCDPASGEVLAANSSALRLYAAKDFQELSARPPWELAPERQPDGSLSIDKAAAMNAIALHDGTHAFEWMCRKSDGTEFPADILLTSVVRGERTLLYGTVRDISDRKRAEALIARMASHDSLTGLVNRRVFLSILEQTIARARRSDTRFAVLYLDLDHFKDVNDTLGHPIGDLLLSTVAQRLRASVREADVVARFGGDEFAILLDEITDPADATLVSSRVLDAINRQIGAANDTATYAAGVAERIILAVAEPVMIDASCIHSGASIGIAAYGQGSPDGETVLSHADVALYRAKLERRGSFRFFTDDIDNEVRARVVLRAEIREALTANQFFLVYQPQVDIETGQIVGVEALLRWRHPTQGVLGPSLFIPEAERSGLIVPLGGWVIQEASRQFRQWLDAGIAPPLVAVNVSGVQFKTPKELIDTIKAATVNAGLPPQRLELELTESVLMETSLDNNDTLVELRTAGHRLAIDDFGSGYSSLAYLRRFPVDRIKIAQDFIRDIGVEPGNDAIVRAALQLARELRIEAVVEGIETATQLKLLRKWGGRIAQGYYYSKPLSTPEITDRLRASRTVSVYADTSDFAFR